MTAFGQTARDAERLTVARSCRAGRQYGTPGSGYATTYKRPFPTRFRLPTFRHPFMFSARPDWPIAASLLLCRNYDKRLSALSVAYQRPIGIRHRAFSSTLDKADTAVKFKRTAKDLTLHRKLRLS